MEFIVTTENYALTGKPTLVNYPDPGFHRPLGGTTAQQAGLNTQMGAATNIYM